MFISKLFGYCAANSFRKTVLFFWNTVLESPASDCSGALWIQVPKYHGRTNPTLMVSLLFVLQRAENTIDDVDYIINWSYFIFIFQWVTNFRHSHSTINKQILSISFNRLFSLNTLIPWKMPRSKKPFKKGSYMLLNDLFISSWGAPSTSRIWSILDISPTIMFSIAR